MRRDLSLDRQGNGIHGLDHEWAPDEERRDPRFAVGTSEHVKVPMTEIDSGLRSDDVAEIVHDLRNPLATISLEMCVLAEMLGDAASLDMHTAVTRVQQNVVYLGRLVQDILDSCAFDAGRFQPQRKPTELQALIERTIERSVSTRDRPRVHLDTKQRVTLDIDDLRIERVIANLVQNALKYAHPGTGIAVSLEVGTHARVSVADAGPGMTRDEVSHVFDKYWRTADARMYEGSGLGLYVARRIVEAHGGTIGVHSVVGRGSKFFFELPLR